ncbi:MAG: hypothetical protein PF542_06325 [Nanoarchaeota archaeon]|jgi:hypothetical protein|nr:hypothetical protein [Nanoarchaeota archaeon]
MPPIYVGKEFWNNGKEWETFYYFSERDKHLKEPDYIKRCKLVPKNIIEVGEDSILIDGGLETTIVTNMIDHVKSVEDWVQEVQRIELSKGRDRRMK